MNLLIDPPGRVRAREDRGRLPSQGSGNLPGGPLPPKSSLDRGTCSATTSTEIEALRRRVWREQGVISLHLDDIPDAWLRQALINEATRRWGPCKDGDRHGR